MPGLKSVKCLGHVMGHVKGFLDIDLPKVSCKLKPINAYECIQKLPSGTMLFFAF